MESNAYLFGQLLQLSDNLHELYCKDVRKGHLPSQLMGSSLYNAAAEFPSKTFVQFSQRIRPYVSWAKTHRNERITYGRDGQEHKGPSAGMLLWMIGEVTAQINIVTMPDRFSDTEKAELFIGYMAAFSKKGKTENDTAFAEENEEVKV